MRVKVSELSGLDLDAVVARASGWRDYPDDSIEQGGYWHTDVNTPHGTRILKFDWRPSVNWIQGGYIIEREKIAIVPFDSGHIWGAELRNHAEHWIDTSMYDLEHDERGAIGSTPLEAAMRYFVASKLGDEIDA